MVESQIIPSDPMSAALAEAGLKPKAETVKQPAPAPTPPPAAPPVAEKPTTLKEEIQSQLSEQTGAAKKAEEVKPEPTVTEVKEPVFDEEKYLSGKLGGKFKSLS